MPSCRCVVQECSSVSDLDKGISLHCSPTDKTIYAKWKRFVRTHRANFDPVDRFVVCSVHFEGSCFERPIHIKGQKRVLKTGSIPTIWKCSGNEAESLQTTSSDRRRHRKVGFQPF